MNDTEFTVPAGLTGLIYTDHVVITVVARVAVRHPIVPSLEGWI